MFSKVDEIFLEYLNAPFVCSDHIIHVVKLFVLLTVREWKRLHCVSHNRMEPLSNPGTTGDRSSV